MKFPVYPEKHRKLARFLLRARYPLLLLMTIGVLLFCFGDAYNQDYIMVSGAVIGAFGFLFFGTFHAGDALEYVEIDENGIHVSDRNGTRFRSTEHRYVRGIEIRSFQITEISSVNSKKMYPPTKGVEEQFIMVYVDGAHCFDDLGLHPLNRSGIPLYWCDEALGLRSCIAFVYSDAAWELLQKYHT